MNIENYYVLDKVNIRRVNNQKFRKETQLFFVVVWNISNYSRRLKFRIAIWSLNEMI